MSDMLSKPRPAPLTEDEMIARLRVKYGETAGNGAAYALIPAVRSAAGFDSRRTIDAYMMSLWPSRDEGARGAARRTIARQRAREGAQA
jgi:hypothetical protein